MRNQLGVGVLGTAGLGAGLMFLLDPDLGARRRAILRDKMIRFGRIAAGAADKTLRDVKNRLYGRVQSTRSRFRDAAVFDDVLVERVRSQMGRAVSHPHAIYVTAQDGRITLSGEILTNELEHLIGCVAAVKGVRDVDDQLKRHSEPGDISSLQGGRTRHSGRIALLQSNWPPAVRLIVATVGAVATGLGIKQRGIFGSIVSAIGTGLVMSAVAKRGLRQLINDVAAVPTRTNARTIDFFTRQRRTG